jgi:hypothetical protein
VRIVLLNVVLRKVAPRKSARKKSPSSTWLPSNTALRRLSPEPLRKGSVDRGARQIYPAEVDAIFPFQLDAPRPGQSYQCGDENASGAGFWLRHTFHTAAPCIRILEGSSSVRRLSDSLRSDPLDHNLNPVGRRFSSQAWPPRARFSPSIPSTGAFLLEYGQAATICHSNTLHPVSSVSRSPNGVRDHKL